MSFLQIISAKICIIISFIPLRYFFKTDYFYPFILTLFFDIIYHEAVYYSVPPSYRDSTAKIVHLYLHLYKCLYWAALFFWQVIPKFIKFKTTWKLLEWVFNATAFVFQLEVYNIVMNVMVFIGRLEQEVVWEQRYYRQRNCYVRQHKISYWMCLHIAT
jgi:hypothetical protein